MADKSAIEWTEATWNPVTGCTKISPGCANCYAETISLRFGWSKQPWMPEREAENVVLHPDRLDQPLRWRRPRMVFVNSMSDLFHERIPESYVRDVFETMARAPQHTYQVLTKRPERALKLFQLDALRGRTGAASEWPLPNVWMGVSIENARFTWRADVLREIPAAVRFISAEPLLGSLLNPYDRRSYGPAEKRTDESGNETPAPAPDGQEASARERGVHRGLQHDGYADESALRGLRHAQHRGQDARAAARDGQPSRGLATRGATPEPLVGRAPLDLTGIDWLIVGGESGGMKARPMHPEWARELRDECLRIGHQGIWANRPAFFFKQWGSWEPHEDIAHERAHLHTFADGSQAVFAGASPKSGGRLLDGREWNEMPAREAAVPA
jgi:protein gp37